MSHEITNPRLGFRPEAARPALGRAAQFTQKAPVSQRLPPEGAFSYAMLGDECLNVGKKGGGLHGQGLLRVITRVSTSYECNYTKLREIPRAGITLRMDQAPPLNIAKLKADMAEYVQGMSESEFSRRVTRGKNSSFYRNFRDGQDKRITADVLICILHEMRRDLSEYVGDGRKPYTLPGEAVLRATFTVLLDSIGIPGLTTEDVATKLARSFPDALEDIANLQVKLFSPPQDGDAQNPVSSTEGDE